MGANKIIFGGVTIMDISGSTVTEDTLAEGVVAYGADGEQITGKMKVGSGVGQYCWEKYATKRSYEVTTESLGTAEPDDFYAVGYVSYTITNDGYFQLNSGTALNTYHLPTGATNGKTKYIYFKKWGLTSSTYSKLTLSDDYTESKGDFLGYVTSDDSSAYPSDDIGDDGYWYALVSDSDNGLDTSDATATQSDILLGKTAYANGAKITGTHECAEGGSGLVMKTGTTTSNVIDTGLSGIELLILYKSSVTATGFIQGTYRADTGETSYVYCSSYSTWSKSYAVAENTNGAADGGTFTWNGSSTQALTSGVTYNCIAVGTE